MPKTKQVRTWGLLNRETGLLEPKVFKDRIVAKWFAGCTYKVICFEIREVKNAESK